MKKRYHNMISRAKTALVLLLAVSALGMGLSGCLALPSLLSDREVLSELESCYGQEFVIISSDRLNGREKEEDCYFAKVYMFAPKDDREATFYGYTEVVDDTESVSGFRRFFTDTYAMERLVQLWEEEAQEAGLEYELCSSYSPLADREDYTARHEAFTGYRSHVDIQIPVNEEDLEAQCEHLSAILDHLQEDPVIGSRQAVHVTLDILFHRERWVEEKTGLVRYELFNYLGSDAAQIQAVILEDAGWHEEHWPEDYPPEADGSGVQEEVEEEEPPPGLWDSPREENQPEDDAGSDLPVFAGDKVIIDGDKVIVIQDGESHVVAGDA